MNYLHLNDKPLINSWWPVERGCSIGIFFEKALDVSKWVAQNKQISIGLLRHEALSDDTMKPYAVTTRILHGYDITPVVGFLWLCTGFNLDSESLARKVCEGS